MAAHIVNNHIIMAFYIDCIHTDICEQSVITCWLSAIQMLIIQIQAIPHKHANIYEKCWKKKKGLFVQKDRYLRPIRWQVRHSVRHAPSWGSARIQINYLLCIFDFFFWMISFCLGHCLLQNHAVFFTTKTLFLSVICSITDTNNNSPWRDET